MFCGPSIVDVSLGFASGNIDSLGSTKHTVSLGLSQYLFYFIFTLLILHYFMLLYNMTSVVVLFAYLIKLNISTRNEFTKILPK